MATKIKQNFTEGGLFFKILFFALPIMATSVLQLLYNAADNIVVGQFSGDPEALAAVGCTGAISNIMINLVIGVSSGAGVIIAQLYGAKRHESVSRAAHTAMLTSIIAGLLFMVIGLLIHRPLLSLMVEEESILNKAASYLFVISLGIPASSIYNFGSAIVRSIGDSKTPLIILIVSGLINVLLNLLFVIVFRMAVVGVALATIVSQYVSAAVISIVLLRARGESYGIEPKKLAIDPGLLVRMLVIGIPAGLQSSAYSISNMFITAGINSFDRPIISANAIAGNIDNILYMAMVAFMQAAMTSTGQNFGKGDRKRVVKSLFYSSALSVIVGFIVATVIFVLKEPIITLYVDPNDPLANEVIAAAVRWVSFFVYPYMICGLFEVLSGFLRGLGNSTAPMIIVLTCACVFRIVWVSFIFPNLPHELESLLWCYPISWTLSALSAVAVILFSVKKLHGMNLSPVESRVSEEEGKQTV